MKKLVLILAIVLSLFTISSCEVEDDLPRYHFEFMPVDNVIVPESFVKGQTYSIRAFYRKPTICHFEQGFYYESDANTRTFALQARVLDQEGCVPDTETALREVKFNFLVVNDGPYLFKFFTGENEEGENTFIEYEIPVVQ